MALVKLYVRYPLRKGTYTICDEITDEVYATTEKEEYAKIIQQSLELFINKK